MSVPARCSLRLPRPRTHLIETRTSGFAAGRIQPRRWAQQQRQQPKLRRTWGAKPQKDNHEVESQISRSQPPGNATPPPTEQQQGPGRNTQLAETLAQSDTSDLVTEVHIPADPHGVLPSGHPALSILGNSSLVIQRQIEMMNVMLGFEQANRYIIMDGQGQTLGYIAEQDHGIGRTMMRQLARTHRSFTTHIFDRQEREVLRIHRPFAYINSRIRIYDPVPEGGYKDNEMSSSTALQGTSASSAMNQSAVAQVSPLKLDEMRIIGEAQQQWAPLRRKYNLFSYRPLEPPPENDGVGRIESGDRPTNDTMAVTESRAEDKAIEAGMSQFAHVNEPFLSWDFNLRDENQNAVGSVNRNFGGFAREIFTDTGVYALRMDSAAQSSALESSDGKEVARYERDATAMTLDQRAVMLATAVSIDFDYFSRHSHGGSMGMMPMMIPMGGGAAEGGAAGAGAGAAGGAAAGEAGAIGAAGAAEGAVGTAAGAAGRGVAGAGGAGMAESGIAGAGTMAGYEAMQRGVYGSRGGGADDASPQAPPGSDPNAAGQGIEGMENRPGEDVWGTDADPWGGSGGEGMTPGGGGGGDGGGDGGGWLGTIIDWFTDN